MSDDRSDELRKQYPNVSDSFIDMMRERDRAERALSELRNQLAHLVGYHERDGVIPVAEIRRLVPGPGTGEHLPCTEHDGAHCDRCEMPWPCPYASEGGQ